MRPRMPRPPSEASIDCHARAPGTRSAVAPVVVGGGVSWWWGGYADSHDPSSGVRWREREIRLGEAGDLEPEANHPLVMRERVCRGERSVWGDVWDPLDLAEAWNADDPEVQAQQLAACRDVPAEDAPGDPDGATPRGAVRRHTRDLDLCRGDHSRIPVRGQDRG